MAIVERLHCKVVTIATNLESGSTVRLVRPAFTALFTNSVNNKILTKEPTFQIYFSLFRRNFKAVPLENSSTSTVYRASVVQSMKRIMTRTSTHYSTHIVQAECLQITTMIKSINLSAITHGHQAQLKRGKSESSIHHRRTRLLK